MMFTAHYQSPLGEILLAADEVGLTGLWFDRAKYYAAGLAPQSTERETPPLTEAKRWLDVYFSGKMPDFMPPLHPIGSDFRQEVWALLLQIPYGQTTTYAGRSACGKAWHGAPVRPGGGRSRGTQPHFAHHPVPPCGGCQRQPDRLCGWC